MTATIARLIKVIRKQRGMSAEDLAAAMRDVGVPFEKTVIANLETGRRRFVTVQELLALAHVLHVAPVDLLVPGAAADDEPYDVTPTVATTAKAAREWIAGEGFLSPPASGLDLAALAWMPKDRATAMVRRYYNPTGVPGERAFQ